jgi:hypothetical protein
MLFSCLRSDYPTRNFTQDPPDGQIGTIRDLGVIVCRGILPLWKKMNTFCGTSKSANGSTNGSSPKESGHGRIRQNPRIW